MTASTLLGPFPAPHKTKQFWIFVVIIAAAVICAPAVQSFLSLPPFTWRVRLSSGAIAFFVMLVAGWLAFRFGRLGWFTLGTAMLLFALWARSHG
jgi:hypothetical protein